MSIDAFVKRFAASGLSEPYYFYYRDGKPEITLKFDRDKWTYYLVREDGSLEAQEGVTGSISIIDKSLYLIPWACKMQHEQLLRTIPTRIRAADGKVVIVELPIEDFAVISAECKTAHKNRLDDAADVGHLAHQALEDALKHAIENTGGIVLALVNPPTDERALSCCHAAMKWMAAHNVRWIATERKIYSRTHKYAGTLDGLCLVDSCADYLCCEGSPTRPHFKNRLAVSDWKSSRALRVDYRYQTAAYLFALLEEFSGTTGTPVADAIAAAEANGGAIDRFILRLDKENGEFEPWHLTPDTYAMDLRGFLSCLQLLRDHETVEEHTAQLRKGKSAAKRAAKADAKRLAKDAERVAKALAKAVKKAERDAEKLRLKTEKAATRELNKVARRYAKEKDKETAKATRDAVRAAKKLSKAKKDDVPTYAVAPEPVVETERETDGRWIAEVTAVSGALAYGETEAEAVANAVVIAEESAPETNEYAPWVPDYIDFVLPLTDGNTCRIKPTVDDRWEIAAVIAGQKYRGTRDVLADAFTAADALVKSKLGTENNANYA